jgi:AcrR family transcriptional regulator
VARPLTTNQAIRRQRIVDAARSLLEVREYDRIQVKDVADEASVALGTLYHYFNSKEHVFAEALVQWAGTLGTAISRRPSPSRDPADRLEYALHRSVRAFQRRPLLARLVGRLETSEDPLAAAVLDRLDAVTNLVYLEALEGIDEDVAIRIIRVVDAVLDSGIRAWSVGRLPIDDVYRALSDAVSLLVPGPGPLRTEERT